MVNLAIVRRAFTVMCYDKKRPEYLTGYRDQRDVSSEDDAAGRSKRL